MRAPANDPISDVVGVHAAASDASTWTTLQEQLGRRGVRIHAVTLLGHGTPRRARGITAEQFSNDLIEQVDDLGIDRFALVGHAFGAYLCVLAAQALAAHLQLLILEEVPAPPQAAGDRTASRIPGPLIAVFGAANRRASLQQMMTIVKLIDSPTPGWWNAIAHVSCPALVLGGGPRSHPDQRRLNQVVERCPPGQ